MKRRQEDMNSNFLGDVHKELTPLPHPPGPDSLRVDVINGWPLTTY